VAADDPVLRRGPASAPVAFSPTVAFFDLGGLWLTLCPRELLADDVGVSPEGRGFRAFALAQNARSQAEVDAILEEVARGGGRILKPGEKSDWGGYGAFSPTPMAFSG
jgi:hypothetical protein